ncbi:MAG TPA: hypothetical protein H9939_01060 [Candidatus Barnesiella merdigallinarum]|nr:hypothetical protein [Candidatus Barnesiella merdigallinarum]
MDLRITFDEAYYEERAKMLLDSFLSSDFLKTDPYSLDDKSLDTFFRNRSKGFISGCNIDILEIVAHNFCTIGYSNGHRTGEYEGHVYNTALISFGDMKTIEINYRLFRCDMHPRITIFEDKILDNYLCHCTIAGAREFVDEIFSTENDKKEILYAYRFPASDDYNNRRYCYRLVALFDHEKNYYNILRSQLVKSQWFALNHILKYTSFYTPQTRMYVNGSMGDWSVWPGLVSYFVKFFDRDYRGLFQKEKQRIGREMVIKHIVPTDNF